MWRRKAWCDVLCLFEGREVRFVPAERNLLRPKPITCGILQEYEFDYCCSFTCFQDSQRVDPIKGGHQAAPAVHLPYGPNQVIADSAGSVFTLQLMEVDQAKTIKSKPPVASETEIHCRKLAVFPQIHFLKPLGNIHQSVSYIIYIYIYISPYVYHYPSVSDSFYSQVSPFPIHCSAKRGNFRCPCRRNRRTLAEIAMDNESTEMSTPKHSRSEESAGARAAVAPPGYGGTLTQKRCLTAKHIFHYFA